jgi:hypothetical protein
LETKKNIRNKSAYYAFQSLKAKDQVNVNDAILKLKDFKQYLARLCKKISKKDLKEGFIFQWIFNSGKIAEKDYNSYSNANIFAAEKSLTRIINKIEIDGIDDVTKRMLLDFICDLKFYIKAFDTNLDYSWLLFNSNSHITNFYNDLSNNIFWHGIPGKNPEERLALATSTPFIIRQSIEYKIKRILGIDYVLINGKPDNRLVEKCFKAIDNNMEFYRTNNFDFKVIKLIHAWSHYYIHGGYRPAPWRTETAINYLDNLFYSGETSNKRLLSLYAGIEVKEENLEKLKQRTEGTIKNDSISDIKIKWLKQPEIAIIKKE